MQQPQRPAARTQARAPASASAPASPLRDRFGARAGAPRGRAASSAAGAGASSSAAATSTSSGPAPGGYGVLEQLARHGIRRTADVRPDEAWGLYGFRKCSAPAGSSAAGARAGSGAGAGSGSASASASARSSFDDADAAPRIPPVSQLQLSSAPPPAPPAGTPAHAQAALGSVGSPAPTPDGFGGYCLTPELFASARAPASTPALASPAQHKRFSAPPALAHAAAAAAFKQHAPAPAPAQRITPGPAPLAARLQQAAFAPQQQPARAPRLQPPAGCAAGGPAPAPASLQLPAPGPLQLPAPLQVPGTARLEQYDPRAGFSPALIQAQQDRLRHWRWSAPAAPAPQLLGAASAPASPTAPAPVPWHHAPAPAYAQSQPQPQPWRQQWPPRAPGSPALAAPHGTRAPYAPPGQQRRSLPTSPLARGFVLAADNGGGAADAQQQQHASVTLRPGMIAPPCVSSSPPRSRTGSQDGSGSSAPAPQRRRTRSAGKGGALASPITKIAAAFHSHGASEEKEKEKAHERKSAPQSRKGAKPAQHGDQPISRAQSLLQRIKSSGGGGSAGAKARKEQAAAPPPLPQMPTAFRSQSYGAPPSDTEAGSASESAWSAVYAQQRQQQRPAPGPGPHAMSAASSRRSQQQESRTRPQSAAVRMSRGQSGSRSTQHSAASKSKSASSQGKKRNVLQRSFGSAHGAPLESSSSSARSQKQARTRASASSLSSARSSSSHGSASSRSTATTRDSYRRLALTTAQELSRALGSASQSSESRYAICAEFRRRDSSSECASASSSAPPSIKGRSAPASAAVSRQSSDASKESKSSRSSRSSKSSKYASMTTYADAVRSAALQVPPRPQPIPQIVPAAPAVAPVSPSKAVEPYRVGEVVSAAAAQRVRSRSPVRVPLQGSSARKTSPPAATPVKQALAPKVAQSQAAPSKQAAAGAVRSQQAARARASAPRPSAASPARSVALKTTKSTESAADARSDDEAGELWRYLENRLGVQLDSEANATGKATKTLAERRGRVAPAALQAKQKPAQPQSRIPIAKHRLQSAQAQAAREKGQPAQLKPLILPRITAVAASSAPAFAPAPARRLAGTGPGQRAPLPPSSPRRNAISVAPGFQRLRAAPGVPQSPVMKDPSLSIITERSYDSRRASVAAKADEQEQEQAQAGILPATLAASLLRLSSESGSEYSQDSASTIEDAPLKTPTANAASLTTAPKAQAASDAVDAADLHQRLAALLAPAGVKAKGQRKAPAPRTASMPAPASLPLPLQVTSLSLMLRTDTLGTVDSQDEDCPSSDEFWRRREAQYVGVASRQHRAASAAADARARVRV